MGDFGFARSALTATVFGAPNQREADKAAKRSFPGVKRAPVQATSTIGIVWRPRGCLGCCGKGAAPSCCVCGKVA